MSEPILVAQREAVECLLLPALAAYLVGDRKTPAKAKGKAA